MIDVDLILKSLPNLLQGAFVSLQITLASAFFGFLWGTVLALMENSSSKSLRAFVVSYVTLFRGTPMLVQILFVYYVLPQFGVMISPFWAACLAICLNSGAYVSQAVRGGLLAVSSGQMDAAKSLGFSSWGALRYIVLPQAFRFAAPSLGNELITLVKDSSLASVIGVMELSKEASLIRSRTYDAFSVLLAISLIYLLMTALLSWAMKRLYVRCQ